MLMPYQGVLVQHGQMAGLEMAAAGVHWAVGKHRAAIHELPHDPRSLGGQTVNCGSTNML